jgi:hypothetical protein
VVECGSKKEHQKDVMWLNEIGVLVQNLLSTLHSQLGLTCV